MKRLKNVSLIVAILIALCGPGYATDLNYSISGNLGIVTEVNRTTDQIIINLKPCVTTHIDHIRVCRKQTKNPANLDCSQIMNGTKLKSGGGNAKQSPGKKLCPERFWFYNPVEIENKRASSAETARCKAAGGEIQAVGIFGQDFCVQNIPDANTLCKNYRNCLSQCLTEKAGTGLKSGDPARGICAATHIPFGCIIFVEDGVYQGIYLCRKVNWKPHRRNF